MVKKIKDNGGEATFIRVDVSKAADAENMVKPAMDTYGKLNILFNNAGIQGASVHGPMTLMNIEDMK